MSVEKERLPGIEKTAPSTEQRLMQRFGEGVIPAESFAYALKEADFRHFKSGTYKSDANNAYLYKKQHVLFRTSNAAQACLDRVRKLTAMGALYPKTEWGIMQNPSGTYQLFAITRALIDTRKAPADTWKKISSSLPEELYRRTGALPITAEELAKPDSPANYIDPGESSHAQNWGWSEDDGMFYPIDVEVIMLSHQEIETDHQEALQIERAFDAAHRPNTMITL